MDEKCMFHNRLRELMDKYVHKVYKVTKNFPRDELYGVTSQLRRSALSVILNYIEGYSRKKKLVLINFYEISYGSLQESKYLIKFSFDEKYLVETDYRELTLLAEEIGAMLWSTISKISE